MLFAGSAASLTVVLPEMAAESTHIWTLVRSIVPPPPPVSVPLPWKTTPLAFTVGPPWMLNGRPASLQ